MRTGRTRYLLLACAVIATGTWAAVQAARPDRAPAPPPPPSPPPVVLAAAPPAPPSPPAPGTWVVRDGDSSNVEVIRMGGTWLGVRIDDVGTEAAEELKLDRAFGARIMEVIDGSPADKAGLRKDDVIVEFDGQRVPGTRALRRLVSETPEGRTVSLMVIRDGKQEKFDVEIEQRSARARGYSLGSADGPDVNIEIPDIDIPEMDLHGIEGIGPHLKRFAFWGGPRLGVSVQSLSGQLAEYFGVPEGEGILVNEVIKDTPAEKAGLKAGDVITRVAGDKVRDVGDLHDALEDHEGESVSITVIRDKSERSFDVTLDKPERRGSKGWFSGNTGAIDAKLRQSLDREREALRAESAARVREASELRRQALQAQRSARESLREALERNEESRQQDLERLRDTMRQLQEKLRAVSAGPGAVQI